MTPKQLSYLTLLCKHLFTFLHANKNISLQVSQTQISLYQVLPENTGVEANDCVKWEERKCLSFFWRIDPWRKYGWWRIQRKLTTCKKPTFFSVFALMEVSIPVSLCWFPTSSHILTACFIIGLCVKFLSLFIQTILWKCQGPRPAPAELNGILDIEVNGNRTGMAIRLIRYTIP